MRLKGKVKFVNKDQNQFFQVLKRRVDEYFASNGISPYANTAMYVKTAVLLLAYVLCFVAFLAWAPSFGLSMLLWSVMGLALAGIGMAIMHDANHSAYSPNKTINYLMGHTLNLVGGSAFNWKLQHNILHHTYTNITHMDDDIEDRLVLKFSPHTEVKGYHRFQSLYAFFFYGLLTLYWVVAKDFIQYRLYIRNGVNPNNARENAWTLARMIVLKVVYFFAMLVAPTLFFQIPFATVICGWLLMHFIGGIILTTIFQLAHSVDETDHPLPDASGNIENSWAVHQMKTTANFSPRNKILSWYVGGLNYQVEHHLFPRVCHVHYPAIAPIVKQTAEEFGIPYLVNDTFGEALKSHFALLRRVGHLPDLNEAIG
jgi:linoleoyl-CoA desaturase